jgi:hypothetical protein
MHDARSMRVIESLGHLPRDPKRVGPGQLPLALQPSPQRLAGDADAHNPLAGASSGA